MRNGLVTGAFPAADDRSGIVIGRLADNLSLASMTAARPDRDQCWRQAVEGVFTVRGIFSTGVVTCDESALFMPLARAQAFRAPTATPAPSSPCWTTRPTPLPWRRRWQAPASPP
ncbi:MAG: hypothetical protein R2911_14370 [Caldilineaceae bacterium]